jgi:hypothetical protein
MLFPPPNSGCQETLLMIKCFKRALTAHNTVQNLLHCLYLLVATLKVNDMRKIFLQTCKFCKEIYTYIIVSID